LLFYPTFLFTDDYYYHESPPVHPPTYTKGVPPTYTKGAIVHPPVHPPTYTKGKGAYMDDDYVLEEKPTYTKGAPPTAYTKGAYMDDDYVEKPTYTAKGKGKGTYMDDDDLSYYHHDDYYYEHPIKICPPEPPAKGKGVIVVDAKGKGGYVHPPVGPPIAAKGKGGYYYYKGKGSGSMSMKSKKKKSKSKSSVQLLCWQ
jgi:hypothetical protein